MHRIVQKTLSTFVALTLVAGLLPATSWADDTPATEEASALEEIVVLGEAEEAVEEAASEDEEVPAASAEDTLAALGVDLEASHEEGAILVAFKDGSSVAQAEEALATLSDPDSALSALEADDIADGFPVYVEIDPSLSVEDAILRAMENENVLYAQPNYEYQLTPIIHESDALEDEDAEGEGEGDAENSESEDADLDALATTNDPALSSNKPAATANAWQLTRMNVLNAWDQAKANNTVTVVVMDTGCSTTHEDLKDRILTNYVYDFVTNSQSMTDLAGHGTEVCGAVAATANNSKGTAGSSYNAKLLPIRIGGKSASDKTITTSLAVDAYKYVINLAKTHPELGIHVVNLSWGSVRSITSTDRALQLAINAAMSLDIVTVAAAGNGDENDNPLTGTHYPSDLPEVVAVTALDCNGSSTPYGTKPTSWCDYNSNKDLIAPGNYVYTTTNTSNSSYAATAGTSISSPLVAGVFALVWAANSALTVEQAKNCVYSTVYTNFTVTSGREGKYGKGIPNALGAVNAAKNIAYDTSNDTVVNMGTEEYRIAPVYNTAKYSTSQTIYTASEIGRSGIITNLAYYVSTVGSSSTGSLKIYLGHTSKTTYGSDATLIPVSQQTLVYSNDNRKVGASYGWESMQLGSTFKYNGTSNLVVTVVRSATSYGSSYTYYGGIEKSTNPSIYRCSNTDSSYASPSNNQVDYYTSFSPALKLTFSTANGLRSVAKPTATTSFTYDGSAKTTVAAGTGYTLSGTSSATVPGTYTCTATLKSGYCWSDYTTTALSYTWKINPAKVKKPSATTSFTYDGSAKTAVAAGTGYTLSGTYSATVPGTYTCTVTPKTGYVWSDGTSSAMEVTWKIDRKVIEIPESVTLNYNGKMQTFLTSNTYYTVTRTSRACSVGTYIARVSLTNVSYYVWSDGTTDRKSIAWFISTGPDFESSAWAKDVGGTANSSYLPFSPNTTNYYTNQFIYTADEIGSAGTIGNISFKVSNNGSFAKDYVRVYMGNTTKSKFNSSSDQLTFNEVTLVYAYSNSSQPWGGDAIKDNYITINLDTAFDYDGVSNLGIIFVVGGGYIDKNVTFAASAQPGMSMYRGSTENPVTTSVSTNYTIHGVRPHIRLGMTLADCSNKYTGSGVNALTIYTAKPSVGCMYYNGAAMVYDMSKGAWVLPSTKAIDFNPSLVTTSTSATATVLTKRGDVNRNGKVNVVDSQVAYDIARNKIKFSSSTTANYVAADANRDNYVDAADALAIQSYVLRGKW